MKTVTTSKFRAYNWEERMKIYRLARRIRKGTFKSKKIEFESIGLCEFIAYAIIVLYDVNYFNLSHNTPVTSPFKRSMLATYWPELYAVKPPDKFLAYWWPVGDEKRGKALDLMIKNKEYKS